MKLKIFRLIVAFVCLAVCEYIQAKDRQKLLIEGQVVNYMARPVEGAEVAVYERVYRNSEEFANMIAPIAKTDRQWRFSLQADVSSQYGTFIVARKEGLALAWDGLNYSRNTKGKGHFLLVSEKACTVTGIVVDHTGKAVSGAKVQALPKTSYMSRLHQRPILAPKEWFTVETNSQGGFSFNQFAADVSCDFWVKSPRLGCTYKFTTQRLSGCGFEVWRSDIRLVLPQEDDIKGRVVEAKTGRSVGGVELTIQADREREDILNRYCTRTIIADANGVFECVGLAEGKHKIELAAPENKTASWIAKPVEVNVAAGRTTEDVQVLLEKGGLIECTIHEYGSERPLAGMRVSVYGESGRAKSVTEEMGTAKLRVPPGEYQAYANGEGYISWRVNEPMIVEAGEVTHLDILLDKSPMLKGLVFNTNGSPAKDTLVTAHPFGNHVYTDKEGQFVVAYDENRAGQGLFVMARDLERSLTALVRTKEFENPVELILGQALTVKGQIADPNGIGIPAARVSLCFHYTNCLSQMGTEVLTDPQGYFMFNAIPPVQSDFDYRVSVHAAGFGSKTYERISIEGKAGTTTYVQAIELVPADVSISGIVVDANGLPAARVPIFLNGADGSDQPDKSTATNEDGRFAINRICKGPLRLQANFRSSPGGEGFLHAQGGDKNVKIILGQKGAHQAHVSLIGKPLPELKDYGIDLSPNETDGKIILVCIFDMEQRPSRHCMIQLAKQAEQLKSKGVTVVAVQASKVDENMLNEWVKNNIPFPVGMIQDDEEKTRFAWGAKSLPSLILTNKGHIVRAVGFGIGDLDEKLASIHKPITKEEIEKHQREVAEVEIRRLGGEIIVKTSENGSEYTEVKFLGPRYQNEWKGGSLGAKYLSGLCNLKNLRIQDVETFTDEGMVYLEGLNNLESLMLVRTGVSNDGLAHLKGLVNLEFIALWSNKFTDAGLEHITEMTELKSLRLDDAQITNGGLKRLKQDGLLGALEFLSLNRTKISNEGLAHLTGMQNLKRLYLSDTQITSVGLDYVGGLTKLEVLILTNTDISDEGLLHLKTLTNLNMLYLRNTQITNTGLAHLEKMTNLVQLGIGGTKITDIGLIYLKALNKLESLDLSHTQVTNSGLAHLEGLTSLNELFLKYTGVSIDGYLDLNEALPDCRIYWEQKKDGEVGAAKEKTVSHGAFVRCPG